MFKTVQKAKTNPMEIHCRGGAQEVFFTNQKGELHQEKFSPGLDKLVYTRNLDHPSPHTGKTQTFLEFLVLGGIHDRRFVYFPKELWEGIKHRWYQPHVH